jgi:hypothetical protein
MNYFLIGMIPLALLYNLSTDHRGNKMDIIIGCLLLAIQILCFVVGLIKTNIINL